MAYKEWRVTYRRKGSAKEQRRIFGQRAAAQRFVDKILAGRPLDQYAFDWRQVGPWERLEDLEDL